MKRYIKYNANPYNRNTIDCIVRAVSKATGLDWDTVYAGMSAVGYTRKDVINADHVWGTFLRQKGFCRHIVDDKGDPDYTVNDFCRYHPDGTYVIVVPGHVVCAIDGMYYDTWDSGNELPIYYWEKCDGNN